MNDLQLKYSTRSFISNGIHHCKVINLVHVGHMVIFTKQSQKLKIVKSLSKDVCRQVICSLVLSSVNRLHFAGYLFSI